MRITYMPKADEIERKWHLVDAKGEILGRLATRLAIILMGKHKPLYVPHVDCGDHIVVVNADKVRVTGRKAEQKLYYYHTGYPAGLRTNNFGQMLEKHPEEILRLAVRRMLPKTKLGKQMLKKLRLYTDATHPHEAQNPVKLDLTKIY